MRLRIAARPMAAALLLVASTAVFAQGTPRQFISERFNYAFQYPENYNASATSADWREEVTLQKDGELALVVSFLTLGQPGETPPSFNELLLTKGTVLCQQMCVIEPAESIQVNGVEGIRFTLKTKESPDSAKLVDPFPGSSLYAFNVHPGTSDMLVLTPVVDDTRDALGSILATLNVPSAAAASVSSPSGEPGTVAPPGSEGGDVVPAPGEEKLLFGLFSTQLSTTQYIALGIALACLVIFSILRIRDKKITAATSPSFYQPK